LTGDRAERVACLEPARQAPARWRILVEALLHLLHTDWALAAFVFQAAVLFAVVRVVYTRARAQRVAILRTFSELHTFGNSLEENRDPREMADAALSAMLKTFVADCGCVVLQGEGLEGLRHFGSSDLSDLTARLLAAEPLFSYLAEAPERWGSLLTIPDLSKLQLSAEFARGPLSKEFVNAIEPEGLRNLMIIGLTSRGKTCGILLAARRKPRAFSNLELRLAVAVGIQVSVALQNWSLLRAAERRDEELKALERAGRAMRETFDLHEQMEILRENTRKLLGDSDLSLSLQASPEAPLESVVPFKQAGAATSPAGAMANYLEREISRTRLPRLIVEDWQWSKYPLHAFPAGARPRTWCGVPIHFSDGSVGVLVAANFKRERAISLECFELIQVLATEAAGAFENARVFQREQRRAKHLALLNELGRGATAVLNPTELLTNICGQIQNAFGYDFTRLEVMNELGTELTVEAEAGYGAGLLGFRTRMGEGLAGSAAETGETVLANSVGLEPRFLPLTPGVRSALSLPLRYQDNLLGVLSLESRREYAFAPQDVLTLRTLADQLAIALHNARAYQDALAEAITDGLTGLKTHRYFMEALERELRRSQRNDRPFALVMMDLDRFKPVNDRYGHLQGDKVLQTIARILADHVRQTSVLARYGGDEFSILIPDSTSEQAQLVAERLRANIERDPFLSSLHVTASFGIGAFPEHGNTHEAILQLADAGMYVAKHENGNRVCLATPTYDTGLIEAYLGVEFKRKFHTGEDAFNKILARIGRAINVESDVPLVDSVTSLARIIDSSDPRTADHSDNVSRLSMQLARQLGLTDKEVEEIGRAGTLHDIGKIAVPELIHLKPARLTPEEYDIIKTHSVKGQEILEPISHRVGLMVRHHHEMFDGTGYPDGLKGHAIPLGSRIITVADCFDTIVSERPYQKARTLEEAVAELLNCAGSQFDPEIVKAFLKSLELYGDPRTALPKRAQLLERSAAL